MFARKWWDQMPWSVFLMLSFKPGFSLSYFTLIQRLFISSSLSAIRVVSSAYMKLLIFLLAIVIPAGDLFSPAFCMMYSACKLSKLGENIQPCHTPFSILNQWVVLHLVLTISSWPTYQFLRRQVRWSGILISKNFPQFVVIHTGKGFLVVNETTKCFSEFPCFLHVGSLISGSCLF